MSSNKVLKQFLTQRLNTLWIIIESLISKLLHRFGTAQEPVGCTATILYKMYKERGFEIKPHIAGFDDFSNYFDSLLFKSPTCTDEDVNAAKDLKDLANVDLDEYGLEMLKAGASTTDKSADVIIRHGC